MLIQTFVIVVLLTKFHSISSSIDVSSQSKAQIRQSKMFQNVEQAMLKAMGLKTRPRPKRPVKVPQYMLDLYNSHSDHPDWSSTRFRFNNKWTSVNTVRAFHHKDKIPLQSSDSKTILKFDLSTYPKHEAIHSAELRLYKSKSWKKANETHFRIKLYRIAQPSWQAAVEATLIDSKIVNVSTSGWETFDVRQAVEHWLRNPINNHGLHVQVESSDGNFANVTANELIRDIGDGDEDRYHQERPLLVTYAHDPLNHHHVRKKRSITSRKRGRPHYCRRHPLTVQFKDVGWSDWIVAPLHYGSFFCAGECPYPITKHLNGTNHAIVQTIMKGIDAEIPNVCCIPTELSAIDLLFTDASNKVVMKKYKDMVVEGCGCR